MSYTKYCDPWTESNPISSEAMNHIEGQWDSIYSLITVHNHDSKYYTKATADTRFFSTSFFTGFDADMVDGYHLGDLVTTMLPIGAIMLWKGNDGDVPEGWYVCDGTTHAGLTTPNLIERFVIGAGGSYAPGDTGGPGSWDETITPSGTVTIGDHILTTSELPSHTHPYTYYYYYAEGYLIQYTYPAYSSQATRSTSILEQSTGGGAHNHTSGSSITFNGIDPRPAYYALYYIMKCE